MATGTIKPAKITTSKNGKTVTRALPFFSDSIVLAAQEALGVVNGDERLEAADATAGPVGVVLGHRGNEQTLGCAKRDQRNGVRVNQDCSFRRQAEEEITYNPANPRNLIAGQNDSRVGYNQCGIDWSTDGGKTGATCSRPSGSTRTHPDFDGPSAANPNNNTIQGDPGTFHTYDAASDPAVAVDSQGSAYFSCVVFDVFTNANGLFVTAVAGRGAGRVLLQHSRARSRAPRPSGSSSSRTTPTVPTRSATRTSSPPIACRGPQAIRPATTST